MIITESIKQKIKKFVKGKYYITGTEEDEAYLSKDFEFYSAREIVRLMQDERICLEMFLHNLFLGEIK